MDKRITICRKGGGTNRMWKGALNAQAAQQVQVRKQQKCHSGNNIKKNKITAQTNTSVNYRQFNCIY